MGTAHPGGRQSEYDTRQAVRILLLVLVWPP
jgi:hypothetical protein